MYHLHKGTLAYHKQRPLFRMSKMAEVPVPATIQNLNAYFDTSPGMANVEESALLFYMLNHANSLVLQKYDPDEVMPDEILGLTQMYAYHAGQITHRLMYYTLLIITRESRHVWKHKDGYQNIITPYGEVFRDWHAHLPSSSEAAALYLRTTPPEMSMGTYVSAITDIFFKGGFSGGYGGKPWGHIADTLKKLVLGETSPEMFTDTAWTLAHNNGPMFNKGMLYKQYTQSLYKILDVQRSGQIPQLVREGGVDGITSVVKNVYENCAKVFPEEFSGHVDWFKVEALGALHHYPNEKAKQEQKYGKSDFVSKMQAEEKKKFYVSNNDYAFIKIRKAA